MMVQSTDSSRKTPFLPPGMFILVIAIESIVILIVYTNNNKAEMCMHFGVVFLMSITVREETTQAFSNIDFLNVLNPTQINERMCILWSFATL